MAGDQLERVLHRGISGSIKGPQKEPKRMTLPLSSQVPLCVSLHFGAHELELTQPLLVWELGKLR